MTHLPNELALKMDGAVACHRHRADRRCVYRVGGRGGCWAASAARRRETAPSADLGGSSKYSSGQP